MSSKLKRRNVVLNRYNRAWCVLVLIPFGIAEEVVCPSDTHLLHLGIDVVLAFCVGLAYRIAVRRWMDGDDD